MIPVARKSDKHACPLCNRVTPIIEGSPSGSADGLPIARVGDKTGCGAVIVLGSSGSTLDGRGIAYLGSTTTHGGSIITASPSQKVLP